MKGKELLIKNSVVIINIVLFFYLVFIGRNQYLYGMHYLRCIIFMLLNSIFIFSHGILKNNDKEYKTNIFLYIGLFMYLLFAFTFIISRTEFRFYSWWYTGQYIPFHTIISQFSHGSTYSILKNVFGNAVALIPLSFLLMIKDKKFNNVIKQSIIILPVILIIELLQASTHTGAFDVDDIILNYAGTVVFTFLITRFHLIDKIRNIFYTDFKLKSKIKYILFYISLVVLIIFDLFIIFKVN
jgi:glycopeptide antibiotics resistance protein